MFSLKKVDSSRLDLFEKYFLVVVFSFFAFRMLRAFVEQGSIVNLIFLVDQLLIVVFVLFRRATGTISQRPGEWVAGFGGTFGPLLIAPIPPGATVLPPAILVLIMLAGLSLHLAAKLTLRRSFGVVAANRGVKASGPYRFVRHPMYAGYMLTHVALLLAGPSLQNLAVILATWALFLWRIRAEERVLMEDPVYLEFASRAKFRLVPGVY